MPGIMSNRNRRMLASCLGMLLLFILLLLASLEGGSEIKRPPKIRMHEVRVYKPPPPPPPPPMEQNTTDSPMPSLTRSKAAAEPVKLDIMPLEIDMDAVGVAGFGTGGPGGGGGLGTGGEWGTIPLFELDSIPMVKSYTPMPYPEEAVIQGVLEFEVKLHIVIDEEGRTYPVRIMHNPLPSTNEQIMKFASSVVFSPPTRLGVPVRTEYEWPLLMKK